MAKADLIAEAEARGIVLDGSETVADLQELLDSAGDPSGDPPDTVDDPVHVEGESISAEALAKVKQDVSDAQAAVIEAQARLDEVLAAQAVLAQGPDPVYGQEVLIEGGKRVTIEKGWGWGEGAGFVHGRTFQMSGRNYEHVADHSNGVWIYRQM